MDPGLLKLVLGGLALLGSTGLFFGIGLALAAHKFAVEADPKVEEVLEVLAGAQCGGCGYPGCEGYAEAVVHDPDVPPNLCYPGKAAVAKAVAEITNKKVESVEDIVAFIRCSRLEGRVLPKYSYIGYGTCSAANLAFGGPQNCYFACIGLGECAQVCPFKAISMVNGMPHIDFDKCVGCGTCVKVCPKQIIELIPANARISISCNTKGPSKTVKEVCQVGCISCKACIKVCPAGALSAENHILVINHARCMEYGTECHEVCTEKCPRKILRRFDSHYETKQPVSSAA